ncbi:ABC transporter substrate-binding protein [Bradyrhizobium sp. Pha-3]|uniref:ABC transporter substrate-binding protein n=1 Tax=Bradyrhizobium sp. Pha-3 TaxID=208375 RepID=UPI0035D42496
MISIIHRSPRRNQQGFTKEMQMKARSILTALVALAFVLGNALASPRLDPEPDPTEIRIGNVMPYTGSLAAFSSIGRAEAAYFTMVNEHGGINGRKVRFISYDDTSDRGTALDRTRRLVEEDQVLLMFGSFGTPANLAVRSYLNALRIPQLFVASGDQEFSRPDTFPWTMGWQPSSRAEGRLFANYIEAYFPGRKIAVLWENAQFGRDLYAGLVESLSENAQMIISETTFDASDETLDSQIHVLRASGATVLVIEGAPATAAFAIRKAADVGWAPTILLDNAPTSIASALRPAGLQNAIGVVSTAFLKDAGDPKWQDDPGMKEWLSFMTRFYPDGEKDDKNAVFGYAAAATLTQVLKQCGDDLSRENVMRQATSLRDFRSSVMLPGISINTSSTDARPIKQTQLVEFDGRTWLSIGEVLNTAFNESGHR